MSKNIQVAEFDIMWSHLVLPETFPLTENKKIISNSSKLLFFKLWKLGMHSQVWTEADCSQVN